MELYSHYAIRLRGFQRDDVAFTSENCKSIRRRYVTNLPPPAHGRVKLPSGILPPSTIKLSVRLNSVRSCSAY